MSQGADPRQREKTERLVLIPLLVAFLAFGGNFLRQMGIFSKRATHITAAAPAIPAAQLTEPAAISAPAAMAPAKQAVAKGYTALELRDPLQSLLPKLTEVSSSARTFGSTQASKPPSMPMLAIQGAWWGNGPATAIINGEVYRVGDTLEGVTVRAISASGITVEFDGRVVELPMDRLEPGKGNSKSAAPRVTTNWR